MRRFSWLLATATTALLCLPAEAAQLQRWQFNQTENRLEFSTNGTVQPQAQMLFNPTRVVVDLPGVKLSGAKGSGAKERSGKGAIRKIRWGQFTRETARLVVEVAPGWTLDPSQVRVQATSATDWVLALPEPSRVKGAGSAVASMPILSTPVSSPPVVSPSEPPAPVAQTTPQLNPSNANPLLEAEVLGVRSTTDGLFVQTSGRIGTLKLERSLDRRSFDLNVTDARLKGAIRLPSRAELNRLGVQSLSAITLPAQPGRPTTTRITLNLPANAVDWQASRSGESGIVLLPSSPPVAIGSPAGSGSSGVSVSPPSGAGSATPPQGAQLITVTLPPGPPPNVRPPVSSAPPINRPPTSGRVLVVIDPGHGGPDPGAVGRNGLRETDITLDISNKLSQQLEAAGIQTLLTRTGEYDLDLQPRVDMAERANATLFVSVHANSISLDRPDVNGIETYYYSSGKALADTIHRNILRGTNGIDRGVRTARFYVLTQTSMPAVLLETGFVTGAQDANNLADPAFRTQMAAAIAQGIREYLGR